VIEEGFVSGSSVIHRFDPRGKTIVAAAFSILVATSDRFVALIPALILALCIVLLARLPLKKVFSRLLLLNGLILLLWIFLPFTFEGRPLYSIGPLTATREGVIYSFLITIRSNAIILSFMALVATMSVFTMGRAMRHLYVPTKIIHLLSFSYRYIHVIHMEYRRLTNAIKIRGFNPSTNLHTYRTYAFLVGMLLVKSHDRAKRVRAAMLCRGFSGRFYDLTEYTFKKSDWVTMMLMIFGIMGIGLLQWIK